MKSTIIQIPSDEKIYQVNVYYDKDTDTFDIEKFRVFAFEYNSIPDTFEGTICGVKSQFLTPISLSIVTDDEPYKYSGVMGDDGVIRTYSANYSNIEEFKEYIKGACEPKK